MFPHYLSATNGNDVEYGYTYCPGRLAEVPVVVLVMEGGITTLYTAFKAIATRTPVLVLAGSGRAADVIARAYQKHNEGSVQILNGVCFLHIAFFVFFAAQCNA